MEHLTSLVASGSSYDLPPKAGHGSASWLPNEKGALGDVTGVFCTSGSEREFALEERWYADEEIQAGADRNAATAD
jgi:hypothetical protein